MFPFPNRATLCSSQFWEPSPQALFDGHLAPADDTCSIANVVYGTTDDTFSAANHIYGTKYGTNGTADDIYGTADDTFALQVVKHLKVM